MTCIIKYFKNSYDAYNLRNSHCKFDATMPPQEKRWKLFIDRTFHSLNDPLIFDKDRPGMRGEPGYHDAMINAFEHLRDTIGVRIDADEFCRLHDICVHQVKKSTCPYIKDVFEEGFRSSYGYGFSLKKATPRALEDWKNKKLIGDDQSFLSQYSSYCKRISPLTPRDQILGKVNSLIRNFYKEVSRAATNDQRLAAIVDICRALEILHAFNDGNQRTIAFTILNKLLIENNLSPAILDDPFMFDGYFSTQEMVELVKQGQKNYQDEFHIPPPPQVHSSMRTTALACGTLICAAAGVSLYYLNR